jgi:hypothetical protein
MIHKNKHTHRQANESESNHTFLFFFALNQKDGKMPAGTAGSNEVGKGGERDLKQDLTPPPPAGGSSGAPAAADASKNKS